MAADLVQVGVTRKVEGQVPAHLASHSVYQLSEERVKECHHVPIKCLLVP